MKETNENRAATIAGMFFPIGSRKGRELHGLILRALDADAAALAKRDAEIASLRAVADAARRGHWRELADWLDLKFPNDPNPEIQQDLRALAAALSALFERDAEIARLRKALDTIANPRRGTPEEYWDAEELGDFARAALDAKETTNG